MTMGDSGVPNDAEIVSRGGRDYFNHNGVYKNHYPHGSRADSSEAVCTELKVRYGA